MGREGESEEEKELREEAEAAVMSDDIDWESDDEEPTNGS